MQTSNLMAFSILATCLELSAVLVVFSAVPDLRRVGKGFTVVVAASLLIFLNYAIAATWTSGLYATPENASAIQALAAVVQALFSIVLIGLTIRTVQANAAVVKANEQMAEAAVQQQQAAIRPVLVFRILPLREGARAQVDKFYVEVVNVGAGAALDTRVSVVGPVNFHDPTDVVQPLAIAPQESVTFTFALDDDAPLANPANPLRWPRTDDDAELTRLRQAGNRDTPWHGPSLYTDGRQVTVGGEHWARIVRYRADVILRIGDMTDVGQIRAEYRDLSGSAHVSSADLLVTGWTKGAAALLDEVSEAMKIGLFDPVWPSLTLGPLAVSSLTTASN